MKLKAAACATLTLALEFNIFAKAPVFEESQRQVEAMKEQAIATFIVPAPVGRPRKCPLASIAFEDVAKQIVAITSALGDSKCYDKHYELISDINQRALNYISEDATNIGPALKDGALVESPKDIVINIANTQVQTVQNQNSLISGLFDIAKDPECVETIKKKGKLGSVASTLARLGSIGMIIPSPIGLAGSVGLTALGGSLSILDKLLVTRFNWKEPADRSAFTSLTCAFYNLRSQLLSSGFFEAKSFDDERRLEAAQNMIGNLQSLSQNVKTQYDDWTNRKNALILSYLSASVGREGSEQFNLLQQGIMILDSSAALGRTASDRFSITSHFAIHKHEYDKLLEAVLKDSALQKTIADLFNTWLSLPSEKLLALNGRTWNLAYVQAMNFHFQALRKAYFSDLLTLMSTFLKERTLDQDKTNDEIIKQNENAYQQLMSEIVELHSNLTLTTRNLDRTGALGRLDQFDDGAQNYYDIHKEYDRIKNVLLGRWGWKFVKYMVKDANRNLERFQTGYTGWERARSQLSQSNKNLSWVCQDAFALAQVWDSADAAAEVAYDFLSSSGDLWGTQRHTFLRIVGVPVPLLSYEERLVRGMMAAQTAKAILKHEEEDKNLASLKTLNSSPLINVGEAMLNIGKSSTEREALTKFRHENCQTVRELNAYKRDSSETVSSSDE